MDFSGRHYPKDLILQTVRWYLRYNLSYRNIEEILEERGVELCHMIHKGQYDKTESANDWEYFYSLVA